MADWDDDDMDYDDRDDDDCDHLEFELDILTGRAECDHCDHRWYLSDREMANEEKRRAEAYDAFHEQAEQESVNKLTRERIMLVVVPNSLRDAINEKLDAAYRDSPGAEKDRGYHYDVLLDHFNQHGVIPDFTLAKK